MIWKIITAIFLPSLILALILYISGVHYVGLEGNFMRLVLQINANIRRANVQIPMIPTIQSVGAVGGLIEGIINFINGLIGFFNFVIWLLNSLINIINTIVSILTAVIMYIRYLGAVPI